MGHLVREVIIDYRDVVELETQIACPSTVAEVFRATVKTMAVESTLVMCLDGANKLISVSVVSQGTVNAATVHPRDVFRHAIAMNSASIILAHNHPSGNLAASEADEVLTQRIAQGGKILGIKVLDHVIVTRDAYTSMASHCSRCFVS